MQFFNLCIFIIVGILLAFIYDLFRITRKAFTTKDFITYLEDILFWIIARSNINF